MNGWVLAMTISFFEHLDREDVVSLRKRVRHHLGRLVDVHLQRVDAVVRLPGDFAQPVRQFVEIEFLARLAKIFELTLGDYLQRMHVQLLWRCAARSGCLRHRAE